MASSKKSSKLKKLLFVDANIWLDFYRHRNEAGLALLNHLDSQRDRIIVTHQLEMEVKKNRLAAIKEGMQLLKAPPGMSRPGLFSDAKAVEKIAKAGKEIEDQIRRLRGRLKRAIEQPARHDPVYKVCQRVFHRDSSLVLGLEHESRAAIRRKALRRFYLGCPPRKPGDTSLGDAINWEWMVECARRERAELVIVSRDADYGIEVEKGVYLNDHLRQEFQERVSKTRKILLFQTLGNALKQFDVQVSAEEVKEEQKVVELQSAAAGRSQLGALGQLYEHLMIDGPRGRQADLARLLGVIAGRIQSKDVPSASADSTSEPDGN